MKKTTTILLFALLSTGAFSQSFASNKEVRDAIILALRGTNLQCVWKQTNLKSPASEIDIAGDFSRDFSVEISQEGQRPVIKLERKSDVRDARQFKLVLTATLTPDSKKVVKLVYKAYWFVTVTRVNVGTITNPVFVYETKDGVDSTQVCE